MTTAYQTRPPFTRHGGAYDRGSADAYYGRPREPHYYTGASYNSIRLDAEDMSAEEVAAYNQGYDDQVRSGDRKDWR